MNSPVQVKVNLTEELEALLALKASKFGVPLTQYVKHVLMKDVEDIDYPAFKASKATEKTAKDALENLDKTTDAKDFFVKLHQHNDR